MNGNLLILGAGQYGQLAREVAQAMGSFEKIDFLDDHSPQAIGKIEESARFLGDYTCAFVAIGNSGFRLECIERLRLEGYSLPVLQHPAATVMPSASLGIGSIVEPKAVINSNSSVEMGCIISAGAVINHNSCVKPGCHVDCNAVVPSNCMVPSGTKIFCGQVFGENME